jgi:hypothetical protein
MKIHLLLIPMLLLSACRTTAGPKEKPGAAKPFVAQEDILLRKRIDALTKSQSQVYDCTVTSAEAKNLDQIKKWIAEVPRDDKSMVTAMHFRATDPSIEYYGYEGTTEVLLYVDHSTLKFPGNADGKKHLAVENLMKELDKICPGPTK